MGQVLEVLAESELVNLDNAPWRRISVDCAIGETRGIGRIKKYRNSGGVVVPDLSQWPPELALCVLGNLNATDLCLASCVWQSLANDNTLWQGLCKSTWPWVSVYRKIEDDDRSYRTLYLQLDEASLTFNADPHLGMEYLISHNLLNDHPHDIAMFIHTTNRLNMDDIRTYLHSRKDVLEEFLNLQKLENQFLANALRQFFCIIHAPNAREDYLTSLIERFSRKFCSSNPQLNLSSDTVFIMCYSLILLSVDLYSPHIKNKMSKREFIRNVRGAIVHDHHEAAAAAAARDDELAGHLYDNIYLVGHVAPHVSIQQQLQQQNQNNNNVINDNMVVH